MVSSPHEAMHRIFQEFPDLLSGVSKVLGVDFPQPVSVTVLPTDLTETSPLERRLDTLLRFDARNGESFLLAVEAQGKKDPHKPASWAYYVSYLYTKYRMPPLLLVVCQDRATAEWASRPFDIGPREWPALTLRPLVAGPHNLPVITDPAETRKDLVLATLAAITHRENPDIGAILKAVSTVLRETPQDIAYPVVELIAQGMGTHPAAEQWRKLVAVDLSFYKSPLSEELRSEGRAEGRAEGQAKQGAEDVLLVLDRRGLDVSETTRARITACDDPEILRTWLIRSVTASYAEEIFIDEQPRTA
ncbi:hypothetical protein [Streptomyces sp. NPDC127084]|uniref:hypothetical protein n=1 Tax=Streptomyces sp. NPDC127084 TaxID=3347133 RepID=UPI003646F5E9